MCLLQRYTEPPDGASIPKPCPSMQSPPARGVITARRGTVWHRVAAGPHTVYTVSMVLIEDNDNKITVMLAGKELELLLTVNAHQQCETLEDAMRYCLEAGAEKLQKK